MRALIALGGNAMTGPDGSATPQAQQAAIAAAAEHVAELVTAGIEVVLTHGNGPQVGNLLVKNELAAHVVPPVPLDWCVAQTEGTIGFMIMNALEGALRRRGVTRPRVATLVTRTRVDADDEGFRHPTKPVGRYLPRANAEALIARGQIWEDRGPAGWRRVVASPQPREIVDAPAVRALVDAGFIVVAAGGGGVPVLGGADERRGVEAVLDKDLTAALLARSVGAEVLVIATDVEAAMVGYGTPQARPLHRVSADELRAYADAGQFASGSMGPKVTAALRFVAAGGRHAAITSLARIRDGVTGTAGTVVRGAEGGISTDIADDPGERPEEGPGEDRQNRENEVA